MKLMTVFFCPKNMVKPSAECYVHKIFMVKFSTFLTIFISSMD